MSDAPNSRAGRGPRQRARRAALRGRAQERGGGSLSYNQFHVEMSPRKLCKLSKNRYLTLDDLVRRRQVHLHQPSQSSMPMLAARAGGERYVLLPPALAAIASGPLALLGNTWPTTSPISPSYSKRTRSRRARSRSSRRRKWSVAILVRPDMEPSFGPIQLDTLTFAVIAFSILAFGLVSGRVQKSVITPPMVFVALGLLVSHRARWGWWSWT